jgi:hypothetical protein
MQVTRALAAPRRGPLHTVLLKCNGKGRGGGILSVDSSPGMPSGAGASGQAVAAYKT